MRPVHPPMILLATMLLAVAAAPAPQTPPATGGLVSPGRAPAFTLFYTGEVQGYLEACG